MSSRGSITLGRSSGSSGAQSPLGSLRGIGSLSPTTLRSSDLLLQSPPMSPRMSDSPSPRSATDTLLHHSSAYNSPIVEPLLARSKKAVSPRVANQGAVNSPPVARAARTPNDSPALEGARRTSVSSASSSSSTLSSPKGAAFVGRHASTHKRRASYSIGPSSSPFDTDSAASESPAPASPRLRDSGASSALLERAPSLRHQRNKSTSSQNLRELGLLPALSAVAADAVQQSSAASASSSPLPEMDSLRTTATLIAGALQAVQVRRVVVTFIEGLGFDRHSVKLHLLGPKSIKLFSTKWSSKLRHPVWKQQSKAVGVLRARTSLCFRRRQRRS